MELFKNISIVFTLVAALASIGFSWGRIETKIDDLQFEVNQLRSTMKTIDDRLDIHSVQIAKR